MFYLALGLNLLAIGLTVFVVVRDHRSQKVPLLSFRNFFLAGYLYFQAFQIFVWLFNRGANGYWAYLIRDDNYMTSVTYTVMLNVFLILFLVAYLALPLKPRNRPIKDESLTEPTYLVQISILLTILAIFVWLLGFLGLRDLMRYMSAGIGTTATGIAAWAWTYRFKRPNYIAFAFLIAFINLVPHLTDYGRRGIVSMGFIIVWVVFYRISFRFHPVKFVIVSVLVASPLLVVLAAFSEVRVERPETTQEAVELMLNADLGDGFQRLATFQGSAVVSMWCIEKFPETFEYRPLYSLRATFHYFIPRELWPTKLLGGEKPLGLGIQIPDMAGLKRVGGLNVGAGIIGHAAAEGGWFALVVYSTLLGMGLRVMDHFVLSHQSPLYRVPFAAALGELFATPRGEVNFFLDTMIIAIVSGFVFLHLVHIFLSTNPRE